MRAASRFLGVAFRSRAWGLRRFGTSLSVPEPVLDETIRNFVDPAAMVAMLGRAGFDFYTGVPDSLLKDFCAYVSDNVPQTNHLITADEGAAVAVACGYHLATQRIPLVYMQNSGLGNAINPLLSLADPKVYSIPMLLMIGWRGEPGKKDEPQHITQGQVSSSLLTCINIPHQILPDFEQGAEEALGVALEYLKQKSAPYAFLVKRQTFTKYSMKTPPITESLVSRAGESLMAKPRNADFSLRSLELTREEVISLLLNKTTTTEEEKHRNILVTTTGFTSRELYTLREQRKEGHSREFMTVGSMGHACAIALGIALAKPNRQVITLDGDGAVLMHMGSLATVGHAGLKNYKHLLVNNGCHESVGGQPTGGFNVDFHKIASSCGYKQAEVAWTKEQLDKSFDRFLSCDGPAFLEIRVKPGTRSDLGRPKTSPIENKKQFIHFLNLTK